MRLVGDIVGTVPVNGHYVIRGQIGKGGFGTVYLGCHDGEYAAVKILRLDGDAPEAHEVTLQRFRREIDFLMGFRHPRVPDLLVASDPQEPGAPWYATRYLAGPSLDRLAQLTKETAGTGLPLRAVLAIAVHLADVLVEVERIGTHRDLKPANVVITLDGAYVVDFGLAHLHDAPPLTEGFVIASFDYVAPERFRASVLRDKPVAPGPADVFTLGGTLLYAVSGRAPFPGAQAEQRFTAPDQPVAVTSEDVPDDALREIVTACLDLDPAVRPTATEVRGRAQELLGTREPDLAAELGHTTVGELRAAAVEVRTRYLCPRALRRTTPQRPPDARRTAWTRHVGDRVQSVTAIKERIVVVTVGGQVYVFRDRDGDPVAESDLHARPTGAVVASGDRVFVGATGDRGPGVHVIGGKEPEFIEVAGRVQGLVDTPAGPVVATGDRFLYRLARYATGIDWKWMVDGLPVPDGLAWRDRTVHVATADGSVHRHDLDTGSDLARSHAVGHRAVSIVAHALGADVVAADGHLYRLRLGNEPVEQVVQSPPVRIGRGADTTLVTCTADGLLRVQDPTGAREPYEERTAGIIRRSLTVARGLAVTGRVDGSLHVLHLAAGRTRLWQKGDGCALEAPATVTEDETVVAAWADGTVSAFPRTL